MVKNKQRFKPGEWVRCVSPALNSLVPLLEGELYEIETSKWLTKIDSEMVTLTIDPVMTRDATRFVKVGKREYNAWLKTRTLKCPCCGARTNPYNVQGGYWSCPDCPAVIFEYKTAEDIQKLTNELEAQ